MDIATGITSTANKLGISPIDLATAISYETGGTFDPLQLGPETKFGQHRGLIQFGEPQANQYGVSFETRPQAISTQLGPGAGIYQYLKSVGIKPGMGLKQIYSAINTGGINNFEMTDERAGGMPGTVAEKVASMGDHRKNAQKFMELAMQNQPLDTSPLLDPQNNQMPGNQQSTGMDKNPLFSMLQKTVGGGFNKLKDAVTGKDPDASDRLAIAMMSLSGNPQQLAPLMQLAAQDIQDRKKTTKQNKTIAYLETVDPKLAEMARNDPSMVTAIMQQVTAQKLNPKDQKNVMTGAEILKIKPGVNIEENQLYNVTKNAAGDIVNITKAGGGGVKNEIIMPGAPGAEDELLKKLMGATGTQWAAMMGQGNAAAQLSVDLEILAKLAPLAPSGPLQGRLAENFPEFNDVSALRQSIIKRIAPTLRVEGSGSTSDIEFNAMLDGFGSLRNSPEANVAIISVFQKKAAFDIARAKIVRQYQTGNITFKDANDQMAQLEQQSLVPKEVASIIQRFKIGDSETDTGPKRLRWDMETKSFI